MSNIPTRDARGILPLSQVLLWPPLGAYKLRRYNQLLHLLVIYPPLLLKPMVDIFINVVQHPYLFSSEAQQLNRSILTLSLNSTLS